MLLVHLLVCFVCVGFCHFSLPLGVGGWLRFVIVALPELFYYYFFKIWSGRAIFFPKNISNFWKNEQYIYIFF